MEVYVVIHEFVDEMLIFNQVFHNVLGVFSSMETAIDCVERDMKEIDESIDDYKKEVYGREVTYTNDGTTYQITKFVVDSFDN